MATIIGIIALGGIFLSIRKTTFVEKSQTLNRLASISFEEFKTEARFTVWGMAIQGFKENPVLGYGEENFNLVFNKYYDPRIYNQEQWFDRAHNVFLDWLIAGGLFRNSRILVHLRLRDLLSLAQDEYFAHIQKRSDRSFCRILFPQSFRL